MLHSCPRVDRAKQTATSSTAAPENFHSAAVCSYLHLLHAMNSTARMPHTQPCMISEIRYSKPALAQPPAPTQPGSPLDSLSFHIPLCLTITNLQTRQRRSQLSHSVAHKIRIKLPLTNHRLQYANRRKSSPDTGRRCMHERLAHT